MSARSKKDRARRRTGSVPNGPKLPRALFRGGFDDLATQWSKNPNADPALLPQMKRALTLEGIAVSEALILAPKVSLRVYGENVVLCRLIEAYGVNGVEQLLEENAVEFVLWRGGVLKWDEALPGVHPLAAMTLNSHAHCEPQASVEMGLKGGWLNKPWPEVKRLASLAVEHTILPAQDLPQRAINAVNAAHAAGALRADGIDPETPPEELSHAQRDALSQISGRVLEGMLLLENDYDIHEAEKTWEALVKVCAQFTIDQRIFKTAEQILKLEGVPSFLDLFLAGAISFRDIIGIRNHAATAEFRRWLWSQPDPRETEDVAKRYVAAITRKKPVDSTWFKVARIATIGVAGTLAGIPATNAIGGVGGTVAGIAAGLATSYADSFGLEKFLRGTNPRRFADEVIRPRVAEAMIQTASAHDPPRERG